jgi:hypothetical protein
MPLGPGKYGANAEKLLKEFGGTICVVLPIGGRDGPAFDVCTTNPAAMAALPSLLRTLANEITHEARLTARR